MVKNTFVRKTMGKTMFDSSKKRGGVVWCQLHFWMCQPGQFSELLPIKDSSVAVAPGQSDSSMEFSEGPDESSFPPKQLRNTQSLS